MELAAIIGSLPAREADWGLRFHPGLFSGETSTRTSVKIFVRVGKSDRAGPKDLVGALINEVGLEKAQFGRIDMRESFALVEVTLAAAETVVRRMTGVTIKGKRVAAKVDQGG